VHYIDSHINEENDWPALLAYFNQDYSGDANQGK
jgi:hypothetical protein